MSTPQISCGPLPEIVDAKIFSIGDGRLGSTPESPLWSNGSTLRVFSGGNETQTRVVEWAFAEFTRYANINIAFVDASELTTAHIRISFAEPKAWSAIGKHALKISPNDPTMVLGAISQVNPSDVDRGIVLHEVGHVFGLEHEWNGKNVQLTGTENNEALQQHAQNHGDKVVSNFPQINHKSIASYFLPSSATKDGKGVEASAELADVDKAWLTVNYPGRNATDSDGTQWNQVHALATLNAPLAVASQILSNNSPSSKRAIYAEHISNVWGPPLVAQFALGNVEAEPMGVSNQASAPPSNLEPVGAFARASGQPKESNAVQAAGVSADNSSSSSSDSSESTLNSIIAATLTHPDFHSSIVKLAEADLPTHAINLKDYPVQNAPAPPDAQNFLGALLPILLNAGGGLLTGMLSHGIQANPNPSASGVSYYPAGQNQFGKFAPEQPLSPEAQQGIADMFSKLIQNPIFTNVVTGIANGVVENAKKGAVDNGNPK